MHSSVSLSKTLQILYIFLIAQSIGLTAMFVYTVYTTDLRFGGDFVTFWLRAVALVQGDLERIYDLSLFANIPEPREVAAKQAYMVFPYPPTFLSYLWPLGFFSQPIAMAIWLVTTASMYFYSVFCSREWRAFNKTAINQKRLLTAFVLFSPFVVSNLFTAQTGFLTGALLIAGLTLLDRRQYLAGVCFGLLCFKPQLGIMLPFALLAGRYYKALFTAIITTLILVAASCLLWGSDLWVAYPVYLEKFAALIKYLPEMVVGLYTSLFHYMRQVAPLWVAAGIQLLLAGIAIFAVWRAFSSPVHIHYRNSILVCATFIAAPHTMGYDMTVFILPILYITYKISQNRIGVLVMVSFPMLLLLLPLNLDKFNKLGIPAGFIVIILLFLSLIPHLKGSQKG